MRMSRAEFARHRNVSRAAVTQWIKSGRIPIGEDNKIHVDAANAILDGGIDPSKSEEATESQRLNIDIMEEKAAHERAKRQLAELKVKEAEGRLIPIDVIKKADFATIRRWRDQLLGLPDRIAAQVAATTNEREAYAIVETEVRAVLHEMADGVDYGRAGDRASDE